MKDKIDKPLTKEEVILRITCREEKKGKIFQANQIR